MSKPTKHVFKLLRCLAIVFALSFLFIVLNKKQIISEHTEIPWSIETILNLGFSVTGFYIWFSALILLAIAHRFVHWKLGVRGWVRKGFYLSLSLFTAQVYTMAAILFAFNFIGDKVQYVGHIPGAALFGFMSMLLGLITWRGGRYLAVSLWVTELGS